jgi:hypothetical protein
VQVKEAAGADVPAARFVVSHLHREEKGSDVNVATHLLLDVLGGDVDAAIVVSNDGDLELPLRLARQRVPVGCLNPGPKPLAGKLKGHLDEGVGGHWWARVDRSEYERCQLPERVGTLTRPVGW